MALELPFVLILPQTWRAAHGLYRWQKKKDNDRAQQSPLSLARHKWPGAPLEFKADDGKATGLLLADVARIDHEKGIDRTALQQVRKEKAKKKKANEKLAQNQSILW
jgi:hypothetical protein